MLNAKLVVVGGDAQQDEIDLKLPVIIGRGIEADLAMSDELISRRHAEIYEKEGRLFVKDLGSRNGTFVNNRKIFDDSPLDPEELLTLGTVTFRAIYNPHDVLLGANSAELADTIQVNFDRTERIHLTSDAPADSRSATTIPGLDNQETIDMDDLQKSTQNGIPVDIAARETVYAKDRNGIAQPYVSTETLATVDQMFVSDLMHSESLMKRYPK